MALVDKLTDEELDEILEMYDVTEPALQRRITAEFMLRLDATQERLKVAVKALEDVTSVAVGNWDEMKDIAYAALKKLEETDDATT